MAHWQRRLLARYTRNLALVSRELTARHLRSDRRGALGRRRQLRLGSLGDGRPLSAPESGERPARPCKISGEEVWLDTKKMRLRRRLPSTKRRLRPVGLKPRKKEKVSRRVGQPAQWQQHLLLSAGRSGDRGLRPLSQEEGQEHSFRRARRASSRSPRRCSTASTCARPFATGTKAQIYVRKFQKIHGEVGSVIVIFDEDRDDRYPYMTTWLGEHQNESDMAFYSTYPVRPPGGAGNRPRRIRRFPDEPAGAPHVRRVAGSGLRFRREQAGAAAAGGPRLFVAAVRGLCGRQAAALGLPQHRRALRPHHRLHSRSASFRR